VPDVAQNMQAQQQMDVCVLDFSKAFDKVGHHRLAYKLSWYGISGQTNEWIKDFLFGQTQRVVVDGCSSSTKQVLSGVPQGSVLGPCLFLFYINDIAQDLHSTVRLFADDTMIYLTVYNERDAGLLQQDLNTLSQWTDTWMMEFHPQKCEVISIIRKRKPTKYTYSLYGQELKHVNSVKYIGVTIK